MLEEKDLQAIKELIDTSITASEKRMTEKIDASENRTRAYIEGAIIPQLQLLAEGHQALLETLAPKSRVEALEDEVVFMKSVIRSLAQDVAELKKAQ